MPIRGARYRYKKIRGGRERLAFVHNKLVEIKVEKPGVTKIIDLRKVRRLKR